MEATHLRAFGRGWGLLLAAQAPPFDRWSGRMGVPERQKSGFSERKGGKSNPDFMRNTALGTACRNW